MAEGGLDMPRTYVTGLLVLGVTIVLSLILIYNFYTGSISALGGASSLGDNTTKTFVNNFSGLISNFSGQLPIIGTVLGILLLVIIAAVALAYLSGFGQTSQRAGAA